MSPQLVVGICIVHICLTLNCYLDNNLTLVKHALFKSPHHYIYSHLWRITWKSFKTFKNTGLTLYIKSDLGWPWSNMCSAQNFIRMRATCCLTKVIKCATNLHNYSMEVEVMVVQTSLLNCMALTLPLWHWPLINGPVSSARHCLIKVIEKCQ